MKPGIGYGEIKAKFLINLETKKEYEALQEEYDKVIRIIEVFNAHGKLYNAQRKPINWLESDEEPKYGEVVLD